MSLDRENQERLEGMVLRISKHLREVESRLDALEQAAIETAIAVHRLGEAMPPDEEKESFIGL